MSALSVAGTAALVLAVTCTAVACGDSLEEKGSSPATARPSSSTAASAGPVDPAAQRYFDAVAAEDADAVAASFAPDAVVVDVGREIRGRDTIRDWAADEVVGGIYTVLGATPRTGGTTLLVRFRPGGSGGFRASYSFDIADGLITRADLQYA